MPHCVILEPTKYSEAAICFTAFVIFNLSIYEIECFIIKQKAEKSFEID